MFDILKQVEPVPGVQIQTGSSMQTPADLELPDQDDESRNPDEVHDALLARSNTCSICSICST